MQYLRWMLVQYPDLNICAISEVDMCIISEVDVCATFGLGHLCNAQGGCLCNI